MPGREHRSIPHHKTISSARAWPGIRLILAVLLMGMAALATAQQSCQTNMSGRLLQNGYSIHTSYPFDPATLPGIPGTLTIKDVTGYGALHDVPAQRWETNQDGATPTVQTWVPADFDIGGSGPQTVFSTAIDPVSGDIFTASTRLWGTPTAPGSIAAPLSAGPMIVYRIDGTTGAVSQIVNITADVNANENFGASYLTYDETNQQLFVVGMDTGSIYRINPAGSGAAAVLEVYNPDIDPGIAEDTIAGELAPMGERMLGLAWNPKDGKLYYSVWAVDGADPAGNTLDDAYGGAGSTNTIHNTIRSVALLPSGAIDAATDQPVIDLPFLNVTQRNQLNEVNPGSFPNPTVSRVDDFSMPVADIQFNKKGDKVLLAESGYFSGSPPSTLAHRARVLEYAIDNAGNWTISMNQSKYGVGESIDFGSTYEGINARGGAAWAYHSAGSPATPQITGRDGYILVTADALDLRATIYYGYQYMDTVANTPGGTPAMWGSDLYESVVADLDGNPTEFAKGLFGDVDIMLCGFDLGDTVWYDTNQDGIQDAGEPGVPGVQVELHTGSGCANPTGIIVSTDGNGNYLIPDVVAGDYSLQFAGLPPGYVFSPANQGGDDTLDSDANATTGCIDSIALTQDDLDQDVGVFAPGTITGLVWCESPTNPNTAYDPGDGDAPQQNVTVTLYEDSNCNNALDGTEATTAIGGITGVAGNYTFTPLVTGPPGTNPPGCYVVEVDTTDPDLGLCNTPITPVQTFPDLDANNPTSANNNFGLVVDLTLGDYVWYDTNQDGLQDTGEPGINGINVALYDNASCTGAPVATTVTANGGTPATDGWYEFTGLSDSLSYCVEFSGYPATYSLSPANVGGDDTIDSDGIAGGAGAQITNITLSGDDPTNDLGLFAPGTITGLVWCESPTNPNTAYDPGDGDAPQQNVTVTLYEDSNCNNALDGTEATTAIGGITGVAGNYTFTPLVTGPPGTNPPGCYVVEVDTTDPDLGLCNTPITPVQTFPDLDANNPTSANNNFGLVVDLTLGDYVWYDTNQDGLQDTGEPGINGINVALYDNASCTGAPVATTVTANGGTPATDGWYEFTGLSDSLSYCVEFSGYPATYSLSPANVGGDDTIDSDGIAGGAGAQITNITLSGDDPTNDLGLFMNGDISGLVWCEHSLPPNTSYDGAPDVPMSPIDVTLYVDANCNNVVDGSEAASAVPQATSATGYSYTGLPVGPAGSPVCYVVEVNPTDPDLGQCNNPITATSTGPDLDTTTPSSPNNNFGFNEQLMLGDYVWYDNDQNGQQDAGEPGVNGITVNLYNNASCTGAPSATTTTANGGTPAVDGWYNFGPVPSGNYCVEFTNLPAGWVFTQANIGSDSSDSDANPATGQVQGINLTQTDLTIDAGVYAAIGQINGLVYCDEQPRNGAFDTGEGRPNVAIDLYRDSNCDGNGDTLVTTQDTDAVGNYAFTNLPVALAPAPPNPQVCYVVVFDTTDPDLGDCDAPFLPTEEPVVLDTSTPQPPAPITFGVILLPPEVIPVLRGWGVLMLMFGLVWLARRQRFNNDAR